MVPHHIEAKTSTVNPRSSPSAAIPAHNVLFLQSHPMIVIKKSQGHLPPIIRHFIVLIGKFFLLSKDCARL